MHLLRCLTFLKQSCSSSSSHCWGGKCFGQCLIKKQSVLLTGFSSRDLDGGVCPTSTPGQHVDQEETRLDISYLEKDVQRYFELGVAPSSRKTYHVGINRFIQFCNAYHILHPSPLLSHCYAFMYIFLANLGLSYSSIRMYLSVVRFLQVSNGVSDLQFLQCLPCGKGDLSSEVDTAWW